MTHSKGGVCKVFTSVLYSTCCVIYILCLMCCVECVVYFTCRASVERDVYTERAHSDIAEDIDIAYSGPRGYICIARDARELGHVKLIFN